MPRRGAPLTEPAFHGNAFGLDGGINERKTPQVIASGDAPSEQTVPAVDISTPGWNGSGPLTRAASF